jgi:hypothetical protein
MKQLLSMAGLGLLGGLAVAGWLPHVGDTVKAEAPEPVVTVPTTGAVNEPAPAAMLVADRRYSKYNRNYSDRGYRAYDNNSRSESSYRYNDRYRDRDYRDYRDERSTGKSVAIVGGSAAAGAAIGGIAGGGKGAAVGALTGGAAGFIYDRLTKKKR